MTDTTGAGHGGLGEFDAGAVGNGTTERKEVLAINRDLIKANPGWKDVSDYSGSTVNANLYNIVANTNAVGKSSERTFSHHMNAFNGKATGVEVWYYAGDSTGRAMAQKASAAIAKALGLQDRGAKATTDLYVVANTIPHCILVEWCFVDNPNDMSAWRKNRTAAINAFAASQNMKGISGSAATTTTASKPQEKNYYQSGNYFVALQDLKTYNRDFSKVDNTWLFKAGSKFAVREIVKNSNGSTHAQVAGLSNTYVTLHKSYVKPQ